MKKSRLILSAWLVSSAFWTGNIRDEDLQAQELNQLRVKNAALEAENMGLRTEIKGLRAELFWVSEQRYQERINHQRWAEVVSAMKPESVKLFIPVGLEEPPPEADVQAKAVPASVVRAAEMVLSLRNLFKSEGLFAYDLLEGGIFEAGELGPVVFRLLDDRGRLAGSLSAERLSFEAGRTGRIVTIVLTHGEERRAGLGTAFTERRIPLVGVDPALWIARVPELFPAGDLGWPIDDDRWDHAALRVRLNQLLAKDIAAGYLRLGAVESIMGGLLFGVDFAELNSSGKVKRHLFADSVEFAMLDRGIVVQMFGCVGIKGGVKTPFPGGVHRVFLPRADQAAWHAAKIPGLPAPE